MQSQTRRVAVLGGNRIPFARSNTVYAGVSNQEMLTATIDGLVTRFGLEGQVVGEVVAGAVLKHARDFQRRAKAGMTMVNLPTAGVDYHVPFGGSKSSSYGAREQGFAAVEFFTQTKTSYSAG